MRKDRFVPMILIVMFLLAVLALPQGFARTPLPKGYGNRPVPPFPVHQQSSPIINHQSGKGFPVLSNSLPSIHQGVVEFMYGSGNVAFATPALKM